MKLIKKCYDKVSEAIKSVSMMALITASTMLTTIPVYADEKTEKGVINNPFLKNMADKFDAVKVDLIIFASSAAGLAAVICLIIIIFTKNERAVQGAWDWLKRIGISYVAIISIGSIIAALNSFAF